MSAAQNKELLQKIFAGLAEGDAGLFVESMADDFSWTITGTTALSRTFQGKMAVLTELLGGLQRVIEGRISVAAKRITAEDNVVVVEAQGNNLTKKGGRYDNRYCFVFELQDGRLHSVIEYLDTELVTSALVKPFAAAGSD